jgi:hypothetical protein
MDRKKAALRLPTIHEHAAKKAFHVQYFELEQSGCVAVPNAASRGSQAGREGSLVWSEPTIEPEPTGPEGSK